MRPVDLPSTSVNFRSGWKISFYFLCGQAIFRQLSVPPGDIPLNLSTFSLTRRPSINLRQHSARLKDLPLIFVNFPCRQKTFHQLSVRLGDIPSISSNFLSGRILSPFCTAGRTFINFRQIFVLPGELQSTSCATRRPPAIFHQLSVLLGELPTTSVNIP